MSSQIEQWSMIFCVIIPIGFYLMLASIHWIDERLRVDYIIK